MRGIQFAARFELEPDIKTKLIMTEMVQLLTEIPCERILDEWVKMFIKSEKPSKVTFSISNNLGIEVKRLCDNIVNEQGINIITFDASDLQTGVYFCILKAGNHIETVKFVIIK